MPYNGDTRFLWLDDTTGNWQGGLSGDGNAIDVILWTPWEVQILAGGSAGNDAPQPGGSLVLHLVNPESHRAITPYTVVVGQSG